MALERLIAKKDGIPAGLEQHYVERDGAFHLDVNGEADSDFRKNNIALMQQLREQAKRFEGIDPEAVRALMAEKAKLEEANALKAGELEKVVEGRVRPLEKKLVDAVAAAERYQAKLAVIQIDQAVAAEATKRGLRPRRWLTSPHARNLLSAWWTASARRWTATERHSEWPRTEFRRCRWRSGSRGKPRKLRTCLSRTLAAALLATSPAEVR